MPEPQLDITTIVQRPTIKINGEPYRIAHPKDIATADLMRITRDYQWAFEIIVKSKSADDEVSPEDTEKMIEMLRSVCRRILLDDPPAYLFDPADDRCLADSHLLAITNLFSQAAGVTSGAPLPQTQNRSARRSQTRSGSTAAARKTG